MIVVAVVAASATVLLWSRHGAMPVVTDPGFAQPSGAQLALTTSFTIIDPTGGPTYAIQLPGAPYPSTTSGQPASDGTQNFGSVPIHGAQLGALLMLKLGRESGSTPQQALRNEVAHVGKYPIFDQPQGHVSQVEIGGSTAYALDFASSRGDNHLREFRFARAGRVYGIGVMYHSGDTVSLDTGLAALQTLHWNS